MLDRLARRHERAFLTTFLLLVLAGLAALTAEAASDGYRTEVAIAWAAGFVTTVVAMVVRHRQGKLILRRAADRRRQGETNQASQRFAVPLLVLLVAAAAILGPPAGEIGIAALGGIFTAGTPLLLWIAFVLRPDQHPGEDL